jgi:hypothetical protein
MPIKRKLLIAIAVGLASCVTATGAAAVSESKPGFYPGALGLTEGDEAGARFLDHNKDRISHVNDLIEDIKSNPQHGGCIGKDIYSCIASLAQIYAVGTMFTPDEPSLEWPLDDQAVDVNGNAIPVRQGSVELLPGVGGVDTVQSVELHFDAAGKITSLEFILAASVMMARTQADYQRTGVYNAAKAALPSTCDIGDELSFYRFIENKMKTNPSSDHDIDASGFSRSISATAPLCGIRASVQTSTLHSTDRITLDNPSGLSELDTFELRPLDQP